MGKVGHAHGLGPCAFTKFGQRPQDKFEEAHKVRADDQLIQGTKGLAGEIHCVTDTGNACPGERPKVSWADLVRLSVSERERAHNCREVLKSENPMSYKERQESSGKA